MERTQAPRAWRVGSGIRTAAAGLVGRVGALLVVAVLLEVWFRRVTSLPAEGYSAGSLVAASVRHALTIPAGRLMLAGLVALLARAAWCRSAGPRWRDIDTSGRLRWIALLVAALLAWVYTTYPYNFAVGLTHAGDRMLLILLLPLLAWRPVAILPFVLVLLPLVSQFAWPLGGFSWAAPILLIRVLLLLAALALLRTITNRVRTDDLVFLLCCLIAGHYWVSGVDKLQLGWLADDRIAYLLPTTYASGWLAFLQEETIARITAALLPVGALLRVMTVVVECGALVALAHRNVLRFLLAGWIGLHAAIFAISGIFFWEWMLLDAAVLGLVSGDRGQVWPIFTLPHFALSLVLIGGGAVWFRPVSLAWLDAPVSYTYRLEGTGASGRTYDLHPRFFAPYDYQFTLGEFGYLHPYARLPITWGATGDRVVLSALEDASSPADVLAIEARLGTGGYSAARAGTFDAFAQRFIAGWNERGGRRGAWTALAPPPKLWTFPRGEPPQPGDAITRVVVTEVLSYFDGLRYHEVRTRPVRTIDIPRSAHAGHPATDR